MNRSAQMGVRVDGSSADIKFEGQKMTIDSSLSLVYLINGVKFKLWRNFMLRCFRRKESDCCKSFPDVDMQTLPLSDAPAGKRFRVAGIKGGRHLCARMAAMGIYPGAEMDLLCAGCGSPCLVKIRGGTLSLGSGVSEKILVTTLGQCSPQT